MKPATALCRLPRMTGKHRAPAPHAHRVSNRPRVRKMVGATAALSAAATITVTVADLTPADAAPGADWNAIARCESSGNWAIHTGFYEGGLQFAPRTWLGYGGDQYAPHAYQATPAQQVAIAEKVLAKQGPGAWPVCFRAGSSSPAGTTATVAVAAAKPAPKVTAAAGTYVVVEDDTLAKIGAAHGTTWQQLWQLNRGAVSDPNMIYVGQTLKLAA